MSNNPKMIRYHDREWGVPIHKDRKLFEFLILEGAQAGLNWQTILNKRENYRVAFDEFDPEEVAGYRRKKIGLLLGNEGIVRNRLKISGAITNAKKVLDVQREVGSFDKYCWQFVGGKPIDHKVRSLREIPITTTESDSMSSDLKKKGFKFVGPTICYAFMQAVGMVNDHVTDCFRHKEVSRTKDRVYT